MCSIIYAPCVVKWIKTRKNGFSTPEVKITLIISNQSDKNARLTIITKAKHVPTTKANLLVSSTTYEFQGLGGRKLGVEQSTIT